MDNAELKIVYEAPGVCFAQRGAFLVHIWNQNISAKDLQAFQAIRLQLKQAQPQGIAGLVLLGSGIQIPSAAARKAGVALAKVIDKSTLCMGIVIESTGLIASTVRTIISTVAVIGDSTYPMKFFSNSEDGLIWSSSHLTTTGVKLKQDIQAIESLKQRM